MILERPIFGWHPGEFVYEISVRLGAVGENMDPHNLFVSMLGEVGVVGTIPFLAGLWLCFQAAWIARRGDLGLIPLAILLATLAVNMGVPALLWKPFWLAMGLTLATASTTAMTQAKYGRVILVRAPLKRGVH
jgi:O-antigen ligase